MTDLTDDEVRVDLETKVLGYLRTTRAVLQHLIAQGWGRIINISGLNARLTGSVSGSVRNLAVVALTKTLAREYGKHNIRFNVVCPGTTMPDSDEEISDGSMWAQGQRRWNNPEMRERIAKNYPLRRIARRQAEEAAAVG